MVSGASWSFFLVLYRMSRNLPNSLLTALKVTQSPLDRQGPEAHLQAVKQGGQGRGAGDHAPRLPIEAVHQPGPADDLGEPTFHRRDHHPEVRCVGRVEILVVDRLALGLDAVLQLPRGQGGLVGVALLPGAQELFA